MAESDIVQMLTRAKQERLWKSLFRGVFEELKRRRKAKWKAYNEWLRADCGAIQRLSERFRTKGE